ncbi:ATP-dependent DNA helicase RecG [Streptomyces sp. 846.5]|nr:ATP-binding protein [Streptomyces sp. 846.5]TDU06640.1 ATP-dependent DNA helicase RecG [Streptomyces sp. 846.5]
MDLATLRALIEDLRAEGSDTAEVEVKAAAGGFPDSLAPTLSAFGNTPGGGLVVLGLDEQAGFRATGVYDVAACKGALASLARQGLEPPVAVELNDLDVDGARIVVAQVHEVAAAVKPCRVRRTGRAYLRAYDGDYELAQTEEQSFLAHREAPRFDQAPVAGASRRDLDPALLPGYLANCRLASPALARFDDEEVLVRTGVTVDEEGRPSTAGLLALGSYPQQYFPNFVIQAHIAPDPTSPPGTRAIDSRTFDGPIPLMLDEALRWVQRNTRTRIRFGADGHGRDEAEYPVDAVRELLSNALVHRDLGPHAFGEAITLSLEQHQLVLGNPGGLWGLTVDRLGRTGVTSARNGWLLRICQRIRFGTDQRVVEALATGIPTILASLAAAGMTPPRFHDRAVGFTVRIPNHTLLDASDLTWLAGLPEATQLGDLQRHALVAMRHGVTWTNRTLREAFPMDSRQALDVLSGLVATGLVEAVGERGGRVYRYAGAGTEVAERVVVEPRPPRTEAPAARRAAGRRNLEAIHRQLAVGPATIAEIVEATALTQRQVHYALSIMRTEGSARMKGGPGTQSSRYELVTGQAEDGQSPGE